MCVSGVLDDRPACLFRRRLMGGERSDESLFGYKATSLLLTFPVEPVAILVKSPSNMASKFTV